MNETLDLFPEDADEARPAALSGENPPSEAPLPVDVDGNDALEDGGGAPPGEPPDGADAEDDSDNSRILRSRYLEYAMSVVLGRALPAVSDGQKPVQRRILYSMFRLGLAKSPTHVKSARIVGDVIGKFHPHGDSSVYEAMVRTAQDFTLRYPLVDGQGNFGSRDGDNAAAMRYTEARLAPIAELLLAEIDEDTVDFVPNYDGSIEEPAAMPARLPFALLNGAKGIAVGMATEMPPHNLREIGAALVARIRGGGAAPLDVPGPDFATGGQIISSPADIAAVYQSGRGSLRVRARWTIEMLARGQWQLVINELPPEVSTAKISTEIALATDPVAKEKNGKKFFSPDQLNLKAAMQAALESVRDESDKKHPIRLVIEPKSSRHNPEDLVRLLLAHTSMEVNVPVNLTLIGIDGRPQTKGLAQILDEWIVFRLATVGRRSRHRLRKAESRMHILEGRQAVLLDIDKAIRLIRQSDDPKTDLMQAFGLTDIQAEDILEIRLRQLARLEGIKIGEELERLREEAEGLRRLLSDEAALREAVVQEIEADSARFGDARRTLIEAAEKITASDAAPVVDEAVTVIVSQAGWVRTRGGHEVDLAALAFKTGDSLLTALPCRTVHQLALIDSKGRAYSVPVSSLPGGRGDGVPLSTLVDYQDGGKLVDIQAGPEAKKLLIARSDGYGFICALGDMLSRGKAGKAFLSIEDGVAPLRMLPLDGIEMLACFTNDGRALVIGCDEIKVLAKGKGVKLIEVLGQSLARVVPMLDGKIEGIPGSRLEMLIGHRGGKGRKPSGR